MPRQRSRPKRALAALPIIDLSVEARIIRYHAGGDPTGLTLGPSVREVQSEVEFDIWNALQQGVI